MSRRNTQRRHRSHAMLRYKKHRQRNQLAEPGANGFIIVLDHLKAAFNVPKIYRSAEIFGAAAVYLVGIGPFDPAPAKGGFKKVPTRFFDDFADCHAELVAAGYTLFALDPAARTPLPAQTFPERSAFIFGHEEVGLSFRAEEYPEIRRLSVPQFGQIESLNVAVVASIVMYEAVRERMMDG